MNIKDSIHWAVASLAAGISLMVGAFAIFDTKLEAKERIEQFERHVNYQLKQLQDDSKYIRDKLDELSRRR